MDVSSKAASEPIKSGMATLPLRVYTIGHSTRRLEEFVGLLHGLGVRTLADIRSFPGSRKFPHFNRESLAVALPSREIRYVWLPALGGRRKSSLGEASPNTAWRHASFRSYADYMLTSEFRAGIDELLALAREQPTAIMCAEAVYWRCHRRLVSDWLVAHGIDVQHIMDAGHLRPHTLTPGAVLTGGGDLNYPAAAAPAALDFPE